MFQGIWTGALLILVDGFCQVSGKAEAIKSGMQDYLENYLKVRLEHEYHVWGKDREELRQTKAVMEAQLQVIDAKAYAKQKKEQEKQQRKVMAKRRPGVEKKVRQDVMRLKQEIEERRRLEAEAATLELEKNTSRQVEEIIQSLF